ncbi:hypothetical protein L873DRAFT_1818522 [Choiromyces venosus 120613-1]|uniref:Uncharacterized protein n=1 Tax=Choiromyces venosus 120613-1 TaxID=1336337 RepID=A0A3N4JDN4_9PEZI|nr:hypothetical protein L873DRAFT_1818522 [Choiromyces venosus 120613-1]
MSAPPLGTPPLYPPTNTLTYPTYPTLVYILSTPTTAIPLSYAMHLQLGRKPRN